MERWIFKSQNEEERFSPVFKGMLDLALIPILSMRKYQIVKEMNDHVFLRADRDSYVTSPKVRWVFFTFKRGRKVCQMEKFHFLSMNITQLIFKMSQLQ
jgi:hypothetical protein